MNVLNTGAGARSRGSWLRRALITVVAATLAVVSPAMVAPAYGQEAPAATGALSDFAACMAGSGTADLLIVMDQSGSLVEEVGGNQPTDPEHLRVDAAQDFTSELARYGEESGVDIRVRTAGFGSDFYADEEEYGGWNSLSGGVDAVHGELEKFRDRTDDSYTEYPSALSGALATAGTGAAPCKAVMMFTDGVMTMADTDVESAQAQMCSPEGPVAGMRNAGVHIFSVGLSDGGAQDMSVLRDISESDDACGGGVPANGQFFEGASAAGLMAAFRSAIPNGGGTSESGLTTEETFSFVLDNSVTPVRLSGQPETTVEEGQLVPVLTPPGGDTVELQPGHSQIGGADVTVEFNDSVPGMVEVEMNRADDWAGEWAFGYRSNGAEDATYRAQITIRPGMTLEVASAGEDTDGSLTSLNSEPLQVTLVDEAGERMPLEGEALLDAQFQAPGAEPMDLGTNIAIDGGVPVEVPLEQVVQPTSGLLNLRVDITTAGPGGTPGTALEPLTYEIPLSVSLETMPKLPGSVELGQITEEETTIDVPITGPGRVWIEDGALKNTTLPDGTAATVTSTADSAENAVTLERGETGVLPLTLSTSELADGPVNGTIDIQISDAEGTEQGVVSVPARGSMTVPVNTATFTVTMIAVLLLAVLIPLGILYAMKYLTGKMPRKPYVYSLRVPVSSVAGRLRRSDTGQDFAVTYDELKAQPAVPLSPRSANVAGVGLKVKLGFNPLSPAYVQVDAPLSIAGDGARTGQSAKLPLVVHNQWFAMMEPLNEDIVSVVILADHGIHHAQLDEIVSDIRQKAPDRISTLAQDRQQVANSQEQKSSGGHTGTSSDTPLPASTDSQGGFGSPSGFGGQGGFGQPGGFGSQGGFGGQDGFGNQGGFGQPPQR